MSVGAGTLRAYHERTKHSPTSVRRDPHVLDWDNQPRAFKVYVDLEPILLPTELPGSRMLALEAIGSAGTPAASAVAGLDLAGLARVLYFSAGVLRHKTYPGGEIFFRAAACTGALYHIDVYAVCAELPGLSAGVYHFGPHDFALRRLRAGDYRGLLLAATAGDPAVAGAPVVLVLTSTFWRNAWKYRNRTYRHCFWDAGTLLANLLAVAASVDLPAHVQLGFVDEQVNHLLGIDAAREAALALVPLGSGAAPPPAVAAPPALALETLPLSRREVDYPLVREAHAASSLHSADDVAAWRAAS
ncbi:MAG TPA: SagB/ThcOx family dehydrogenase, partial [Candidatus Limnocylindria bacterium]|nr:SagB/ThcOx family dehydrogenase [Candidatus Limnocylindria bacterium]